MTMVPGMVIGYDMSGLFKKKAGKTKRKKCKKKLDRRASKK